MVARGATPERKAEEDSRHMRVPGVLWGSSRGPEAGGVSSVSSVSWTGGYPTLDSGCRDVGAGGWNYKRNGLAQLWRLCVVHWCHFPVCPCA